MARPPYPSRIVLMGVAGCGIFVHLSGTKDLIAARAGHFMPTTLIDSQFDALEPPTADENAITVEIDMPLEDSVDQIVALLGVPIPSTP